MTEDDSQNGPSSAEEGMSLQELVDLDG